MGKAVIVSWVTMEERGSDTVVYWSENSKQKNIAKGIVTTYTFYDYTSGFIHHCNLTDLEVLYKYSYIYSQYIEFILISFIEHLAV